MTTPRPDAPQLDPNFHRNRENFPQDELLKYVDPHVAWSMDGTHILASGETREEVSQRLQAAVIPLDRVVRGYVDPL